MNEEEKQLTIENNIRRLAKQQGRKEREAEIFQSILNMEELAENLKLFIIKQIKEKEQ